MRADAVDMVDCPRTDGLAPRHERYAEYDHCTCGLDAMAGAAYMFRNQSGTRIKIVCIDCNGVCLSLCRRI
jgi:hypothetical protein